MKRILERRIKLTSEQDSRENLKNSGPIFFKLRSVSILTIRGKGTYLKFNCTIRVVLNKNRPLVWVFIIANMTFGFSN